MAKGFGSSTIPSTWLTSSRKDQTYGLPEIGEFLRDEWSQKRKDFKPPAQQTSFVVPKREVSASSDFRFYNNNYPVPGKGFCSENEQQTISSQTEALKGDAVSNNGLHCGGIVADGSVFTNGADVFHDNLYSTVVSSSQASKESHCPKKEHLSQSSTTFFDNKMDNSAQKVAETIPHATDYSHAYAGCHEEEINRPCSFSELLNDDLLSQAVETLNEPPAMPDRVWESNCYNVQPEFGTNESNSTSPEKYSTEFIAKPLNKPTVQNQVTAQEMGTFSTDSRFVMETDSYEYSTHNFASYFHDNSAQFSNSASRNVEAIKQDVFEPTWKRSPKVRRKNDNELGSLDQPVVHEQLDGNNHHLCNYLFEDIDLSVVDKSCMEQLEKEYQNEAVKEVEFACSLLNLAKDPCKWDANQVQKWVMWTVHQCRLSSVDVTLFSMPGKEFCSMTENMMRSLAPLCGDILHARLDVWRSVAKLSGGTEKKYCELNTKSNSTNQVSGGSNSNPSKESNGDLVEAMTPNHTSGIHLWQFLKELLLQPDRYGRCIRWIDRDQGVFKIEDSVEVARLWGVRKNRPAMNYDKLSRSIRQYYKKGIIRKTEISQRLVYQFVKKII